MGLARPLSAAAQKEVRPWAVAVAQGVPGEAREPLPHPTLAFLALRPSLEHTHQAFFGPGPFLTVRPSVWSIRPFSPGRFRLPLTDSQVSVRPGEGGPGSMESAGKEGSRWGCVLFPPFVDLASFWLDKRQVNDGTMASPRPLSGAHGSQGAQRPRPHEPLSVIWADGLPGPWAKESGWGLTLSLSDLAISYLFKGATRGGQGGRRPHLELLAQAEAGLPFCRIPAGAR